MSHPGHLDETLTQIAANLGHEFAELELLGRALTHSSLSDAGINRLSSNERLEFLGDRVLGLIVAEMLLRRFPEEPEGDISRRHAAMVRQETLVRVAEKLNIAPHIAMSLGEERSGGRKNPALLADTMEAMIAALYEDGGLEAARRFIDIHWPPMIDETPEPPIDAKTSLQEWAQGRGLPLPVYSEVNRDGPPHDPVFTVEATVKGYPGAQATGRSKRAAEQVAAENLLSQLEDSDAL